MGWRWARLESVLRGGGFLDKVRGLLGESLRSLGEDLFAMRLGTEGLELVAVLARHSRVRADEFDGERVGCGDDEVLFCPFSARNAAQLRALFPWCRPSLIGRNAAFGMGYRSPWVLGNLVQARAAARHEVAVVLAQQSAREIERTGRTFQEVLDSAVWAAFAAGLTGAWGADADHLKTVAHVREAVRAGFTLYTYDVAEEIRPSPPGGGGPSQATESRGLLSRRVEIAQIEGAPVAYEFSLDDLSRLDATFGRALGRVKSLYDATAEELGGRPFDVEISLDEADAETHPSDLVFLAHELARLGVRFRSIAPRFPGNFEKAVDFFDGWTEAGAKNTEVRRFRERLFDLASIARHFGFEIGVHTGSDKFRIYPLLARACRDLVHVKTAGTIYLEELRVVAARSPGLFRRILQTSLDLFEKERRSYALSARPERIPDSAESSGEELADLVRADPAHDDLRQVLHVSYGPVIREFGEEMREVLARNAGDLETFAGEHLSRHVHLCGLDGSAARFRAIEGDALEGKAAAIRAHFATEDYLGRLARAEARAKDEGIESLDEGHPIVRLGMVVREGRVVAERLGVFGLARILAENPDLLDRVRVEATEIRERIRAAHGVELGNILWIAADGGGEDKRFLGSLGMFGRARVILLDSTDPAGLAEILASIEQECDGDLARGLKASLVVAAGSHLGSVESAIQLEAIGGIYRSLGIESESNFVVLGPPGEAAAAEDAATAERPWRRLDLEPDGRTTTLARQAAPLTRGCLFALALNDHDLHLWARQAVLSPGELSAALDLAAFIEAEAEAGRNKMVLCLPAGFDGAGGWMRQQFEQGLGPDGRRGLKVVAGEPIRLDAYFPAADPRNDRFFLEVEVEGHSPGDAAGLASLRGAGYAVHRIRLLKRTDVARFMQLVHHAVYALGFLREANVVSEPSLEEHESLVHQIWELEGAGAKGIAGTPSWQELDRTADRLTAGEVTLYFDSLVQARLLDPDDAAGEDAAGLLARVVANARPLGIEYAEIAYHGDLGRSPLGRELKDVLEEAADACFRRPLRMPAQVGEGPALLRASFEMTRGWGRGLTIAIVADEHSGRTGSSAESGEFLKAQWLAAKLALENRSRWVVGLKIPRLTRASIDAIETLFAAAAERITALARS